MTTNYETLQQALTLAATQSVDKASITLAKNGIAIFPCRDNKSPYTAHGFKDATTDKIQIEKWWKEHPDALIGLPTGAQNGLLVVDCDEKHGKHGVAAFRVLVGRDPETFTVTTPTGGKHYYYRWSSACPTNSQDKLGYGIDVRSEGGYVITVPSNASTGLYTVKDSININEYPNYLLDINNKSVYDSERSETLETSEAIASDSSELSKPSYSSLDLDKHIPKTIGERNKCIFNLARYLKYNTKMDIKALKPVFKVWFNKSVHIIGTKEFDISWSDFVHAHKRANYAPNDNPLPKALEAARQYLPPEASEFESEENRLLVGVCYHLGKQNEGRFFLSSHKAGAILGIPQITVYRMLEVLCMEEIIDLVAHGNARQANRYLWKGTKESNHPTPQSKPAVRLTAVRPVTESTMPEKKEITEEEIDRMLLERQAPQNMVTYTTELKLTPYTPVEEPVPLSNVDATTDLDLITYTPPAKKPVEVPMPYEIIEDDPDGLDICDEEDEEDEDDDPDEDDDEEVDEDEEDDDEVAL